MKKLLIIDDERPILEVMEIFLTRKGYEVRTAENGKKGLEIFEQESLNLVITDIKMPVMEGLEVLKRIKTMDNDAEVIVVTGYGDMDSATAALKYGASDFINKPIQFEALVLALERAKQKIAIRRQLKDYTENLEQILEERTRELRHAHEELIESARFATIGETVAGLAHYIKNILTGLRGGMYMVDVGMSKDKPLMLHDGWGMVHRNIEKVSDLVLDLLKYSKERVPELTVCSPNIIVSDGVELMKERAKENGVKLNMVLDANLKEAYLDLDGINDVLLNLISNAIDACLYDTDTSKVWEVTVKTVLETDSGSGEFILFQVIDNGVGMTDEVKSKLFSRFFSTKAGRGTGLGLLITKKIAHEQGGEISVESSAGQGTTFSVRFKRQYA